MIKHNSSRVGSSSKTSKTELLFIAQFLKLLKIGGRAAVIVPNGVLFGSSKAHTDIRKELIENNCLKAVISLPSGVFKPYAGVSTAILIFVKTGNGGTDKIWFYDLHSDGYSLDDKRQQIEENDIPDVIKRYGDLINEEKEQEQIRVSLFLKKKLLQMTMIFHLTNTEKLFMKKSNFLPLKKS